ncbi:MAG: peptidyl-prolyl cis-trans isomerase [Vicinamibacteraceae bacterium]|nr:peptidyl-prolyl cis-trans isomerase [Vicinamibacteraceae bacterium]
MRHILRTAALAACALAAATAAPRAEIIEQIIVKVNGEIFTKTELEQRQIQALRARNRNLTEEDLRNDATLRKALDEVTPQILIDVVDEMIIMQQGRDRGWRLGDDQFNSILERIRKENKLESEEAFKAALAQEGMSLADLRRNLERQMIVSRVQSDAVGRLQVTEEEARQYYTAHQDEFASPAQVTMREILVQVPSQGEGAQQTFNAAADDAAKEKAEQLRVRVTTGGEDFAAVAGAESASASRANGGLIGPINVEDLEPSLRSQVEKMSPGDVTPPVRTQSGYRLFKIETLSPKAVRPFAEVREQISNRVYQQKAGVELRKHIAKLRSQALIEWKNPELQKLYEQALAKETLPPAESPAPAPPKTGA